MSFLELQRRLMTPRKELRNVATEAPAALVAFDLLLDSERSRQGLRFSERRKWLDRMIRAVKSPLLQLVTQTDDPSEASAWLEFESRSG